MRDFGRKKLHLSDAKIIRAQEIARARQKSGRQRFLRLNDKPNMYSVHRFGRFVRLSSENESTTGTKVPSESSEPKSENVEIRRKMLKLAIDSLNDADRRISDWIKAGQSDGDSAEAHSNDMQFHETISILQDKGLWNRSRPGRSGRRLRDHGAGGRYADIGITCICCGIHSSTPQSVTGRRSPKTSSLFTPPRPKPRRWTGSPSSQGNGRNATRPSSGSRRTRGPNSFRSCGSTGR